MCAQIPLLSPDYVKKVMLCLGFFFCVEHHMKT